jgi:hypothetical protein
MSIEDTVPATATSGIKAGSGCGTNTRSCEWLDSECRLDNRPYIPKITDPDPNHHYTFLHGDPDELPDGRLVYLCRICDCFENAEHFKSHDRKKNIWYYNYSLRILANLSCGKWVSRPDSGAADENLIERALHREWERENPQKPSDVRQPLGEKPVHGR